MSLEWSAIAVWLYIEVAIISLFLIPWITPNIWSKVFKSGLANFVESYARVYVVSGAAVLLLLFADAVRQVREYSDVESHLPLADAQADTLVHLRLFRAQRNLYISGFALFLWLIIHRMVELIKQEAQLEARVEEAIKLARGAHAVANDIINKPDDTAELRKELDGAKTDRDQVMKQAESLQNEYNRLCDEYNALTETTRRAQEGGTPTTSERKK